MKINGIELKKDVTNFAYDGCHKIYIIESESDATEAVNSGYVLMNISRIEDTYNESCGLQFISNWELTEQYLSVKKIQLLKYRLPFIR